MPRPKGSKNKPKGEGAKAKGAKSFRKNTKTGATGDQVEGKAGAPAQGAVAAVQPSEVRKMASGTYLKSLLSTCKGYKANIDQITGKLREELAFAKDKKNVDTGPFGWLRKIHKMADDDLTKAADFVDTFLYYLDASGLADKLKTVGRLPLGDGSAASEAAGDEEADGEAAEAATESRNGTDAAPAANGTVTETEPGNVSRPRFGQPPRSQSAVADERRAEAVGDTKH